MLVLFAENSATGKTLIGYLTERRLQAALVLLRSTDDKVLSIALDCGFESLGHFYRLFQSQFAMTPRAYRLKQQAIIYGPVIPIHNSK